MKRIFIVGCGDIGRRVARLWQARGATVSALARSEASAAALHAAGIEPLAGDLDRPATLLAPPEPALVYYFAPPPAQGVEDPRMTAFLAALAARPPRRLIYLSTSGVYGDRGGAWVNEESPPRPQSDRARRRLAAEEAVRRFARQEGMEAVVLRVGGIYGDGRLPLARLRRGEPVLREVECGYTNRIHADDLAAVALAAGTQPQVGPLYNVSDGRPGTMTGYFFAVADAFGLPRPEALTMEEARRRLTPAMLSYLTESRRMDNRRMREELGVALQYPELASGLRQAAEKP